MKSDERDHRRSLPRKTQVAGWVCSEELQDCHRFAVRRATAEALSHGMRGRGAYPDCFVIEIQSLGTIPSDCIFLRRGIVC